MCVPLPVPSPPLPPPTSLLSTAPFAGTQHPEKYPVSPKYPPNLGSKEIAPQNPLRFVQPHPPRCRERFLGSNEGGYLLGRCVLSIPPSPFPPWGGSSPSGAHGWDFFGGEKRPLGCVNLRLSPRVLRKGKSRFPAIFLSLLSEVE